MLRIVEDMSIAVSEHATDTYTKLIEILDQNGAQYRLIDHPEEGRTEIVSPMRGHDVSKAAKCMILMVKIGKKDKRFILSVVPGHARVNLNAVKALFDGTYISFASQDIAESLAGCVAGTVLPFSFSKELLLIVDPSLKDSEVIYFNAARLDRSVELKTSDYLRIANPRFERIAELA
jgi:Ala-tRNA(Pro) deacylase